MKWKIRRSRRSAGSVVFLALSATVVALCAALVTNDAESSGGASPFLSSSYQARTILIDRPPVRTVATRYAGHSAVAVDSIRDEIVTQDQSQHNLLFYDRLANTAPTAAMTEPKRIIGGPATRIGSNCGLYVDPFGGDVYSVHNDVQNYMTVFSRGASGNVAPDRVLLTPHRTFGIAVDEETKELFLTIQHPEAVLVWPKMAEGAAVPIRILQGHKTRLADAHGIALDTKNHLMFVANRGTGSHVQKGMGFSEVPVLEDGTWFHPRSWWRYYQERYVPGSGFFEDPSVTVFPLNASGNTPPIRVIQGPRTQLNWPAQIHIDLARQELLVADAFANAISVFRTADAGDVAPVRVIKGPNTKLKNPHGVFVDEANEEIAVANFGNHSVTVYPRTAAGDVAPIRVIRSAPEGTLSPMFGNIGALAFDTKREQILAPN